MQIDPYSDGSGRFVISHSALSADRIASIVPCWRNSSGEEAKRSPFRPGTRKSFPDRFSQGLLRILACVEPTTTHYWPSPCCYDQVAKAAIAMLLGWEDRRMRPAFIRPEERKKLLARARQWAKENTGSQP
jgi:hypothetical protein